MTQSTRLSIKGRTNMKEHCWRAPAIQRYL